MLLAPSGKVLLTLQYTVAYAGGGESALSMSPSSLKCTAGARPIEPQVDSKVTGIKSISTHLIT